jgi:hypothetical protein
MVGLAVQIELANVVAVQCLHDADPREHRRPVRLRDQDERLNRGLPCRMLLLGLRQLGDELAGILQRDKLATVRQRYRFVECALPACRCHQANLSRPAEPRGRKMRNRREITPRRGAGCGMLFTSLLEIWAYVNPLENLNYSGGLVELSTMPTNWTLSTIEAALFVALVVILAGAGTWAAVG